MAPYAPPINFRELYDRFDAPVTTVDCGQMCAPHNPTGKPFCCDICQAVPAAFRIEWKYLKQNTDLWHTWRGSECPQDAGAAQELRAATPAHMQLLACKGPAHCQRTYRAVSCRQFPYFPYVTSDYRFIGLAPEWEFEQVCWVLQNPQTVTEDYRREFVQTYDRLFADWQEELESYAARSEEMRAHFAGLRRRIPLLHRSGGWRLISPGSERMVRLV